MSKSRRKVKGIKYQKGKTCPRCKKNKLTGCDQVRKKGHENHVFCPTCKYTNF